MNVNLQTGCVGLQQRKGAGKQGLECQSDSNVQKQNGAHSACAESTRKGVN